MSSRCRPWGSFNRSAFSYQLEVSQLEGSLQQPKAQSAMSPYLIPDTQALCYHLPLIRQLATSGRFIVIIPRTGELTGRLGADLNQIGTESPSSHALWSHPTTCGLQPQHSIGIYVSTAAEGVGIGEGVSRGC